MASWSKQASHMHGGAMIITAMTLIYSIKIYTCGPLTHLNIKKNTINTPQKNAILWLHGISEDGCRFIPSFGIDNQKHTGCKVTSFSDDLFWTESPKTLRQIPNLRFSSNWNIQAKLKRIERAPTALLIYHYYYSFFNIFFILLYYLIYIDF